MRLGLGRRLRGGIGDGEGYGEDSGEDSSSQEAYIGGGGTTPVGEPSIADAGGEADRYGKPVGEAIL